MQIQLHVMNELGLHFKLIFTYSGRNEIWEPAEKYYFAGVQK